MISESLSRLVGSYKSITAPMPLSDFWKPSTPAEQVESESAASESESEGGSSNESRQQSKSASLSGDDQVHVAEAAEAPNELAILKRRARTEKARAASLLSRQRKKLLQPDLSSWMRMRIS